MRLCVDILNLECDFDLDDDPMKVHFVRTFPRVTPETAGIYKDYFKFAFVRNPWDRLVSCYTDKIKKIAKHANSSAERGAFANYKGQGNFHAGMNFADFVRAVCAIPDATANRHFRSQHTFLIGPGGNLLTDYAGKLEESAQTFPFVLSKLGLDPRTLPQLNKSTRKDNRSYYTDDLIRLAYQRYQRDIELFGYDFS
jgi:hypothetical protein